MKTSVKILIFIGLITVLVTGILTFHYWALPILMFLGLFGIYSEVERVYFTKDRFEKFEKLKEYNKKEKETGNKRKWNEIKDSVNYLLVFREFIYFFFIFFLLLSKYYGFGLALLLPSFVGLFVGWISERVYNFKLIYTKISGLFGLLLLIDLEILYWHGADLFEKLTHLKNPLF